MVPWGQCRQRIFQDFDQDEDRGRGRLRVDHGDQGNVYVYTCVCVCVRICICNVYDYRLCGRILRRLMAALTGVT